MESKIEFLAILSQFKERCSQCHQEMHAIIFDGSFVPSFRPDKANDYFVWKKNNIKTDTFLGIFTPVSQTLGLPSNILIAIARPRLKLQGTNIYTDLQISLAANEKYLLKNKFERPPLWIIELSCFQCGNFKKTYAFFNSDSVVKISKWAKL